MKRGSVFLGTDTFLPIRDNIGLTGTVGYNSGDIIEDTIKGQLTGWIGRVGIEVRF